MSASVPIFLLVLHHSFQFGDGGIEYNPASDLAS